MKTCNTCTRFEKNDCRVLRALVDINNNRTFVNDPSNFGCSFHSDIPYKSCSNCKHEKQLYSFVCPVLYKELGYTYEINEPDLFACNSWEHRT